MNRLGTYTLYRGWNDIRYKRVWISVGNNVQASVWVSIWNSGLRSIAVLKESFK